MIGGIVSGEHEDFFKQRHFLLMMYKYKPHVVVVVSNESHCKENRNATSITAVRSKV